jgi:hypothetical protein
VIAAVFVGCGDGLAEVCPAPHASRKHDGKSISSFESLLVLVPVEPPEVGMPFGPTTNRFVEGDCVPLGVASVITHLCSPPT